MVDTSLRDKLKSLFDDGTVSLVKTKRWPKSTWSFRGKQDTATGRWNLYVITHPDNLREMSDENKVILLHELGHIHRKYQWFWADEVMATVMGWWSYDSRLGLGVSFRHVLAYLYRERRYWLRSRKSAEALIASLRLGKVGQSH